MKILLRNPQGVTGLSFQGLVCAIPQGRLYPARGVF
nr:MAG TPA: hypothetical protein [Caudoviricetes sp.]